MDESKIVNELSKIQQSLNCPKTIWNEFGGYNYRSTETILEAVKPMLPENSLITLDDDIVFLGDRYYVKATATFHLDHETISTHAYAREDKERKKMDGSQLTGAASSYARKYALGGLLLIDDIKDADALNKHDKDESENEKPDARYKHCKDKPENGKPTTLLTITHKQKELLYNKMTKDNDLTDPETVKFMDWYMAKTKENPLSAKQASEFITNFDKYLGEFTKSPET